MQKGKLTSTDTQPIPSLLETPRVHFLHVANPPRLLLKLPWIFRAPIRVLYQIFSVIWLAVFVVPCNTQVLMVQVSRALGLTVVHLVVRRCPR